MKSELIFVILFAGAAAAAEPGPVLSVTGLGKAELGMPVDRVERELSDKLGYSPYDNHGCSVITTHKMEPTGVSVVIDTKILTRINVDFYGTDPRPLDIKTGEGIGLTSSEEDLTKAYAGRMRIEKNELDPTWHTIYVDAPDRKSALVFETNGKTVKSMRTGYYPGIIGHNGCE